MNPNSEDQPIRALRRQTSETRPDFLSRVRSKIHRRTATKQLANYSWKLPKLALLEMVGVLGHVFTAFKSKKET